MGGVGEEKDEEEKEKQEREKKRIREGYVKLYYVYGISRDTPFLYGDAFSGRTKGNEHTALFLVMLLFTWLLLAVCFVFLFSVW